MKEIAKNKYDGYVEILYKTAKRYYRIVRTASGNMYDIFANDSEYGEKRYDYEIDYQNRTVREWTIKDCKKSIEAYDVLN